MTSNLHFASTITESSNYEIKKRKVESVYFLVFVLAFGLPLFSTFVTSFIGAPQQTISHGSQPHGSSTKTTKPHSSHLYLSPFLFAKNQHLP